MYECLVRYNKSRFSTWFYIASGALLICGCASQPIVGRYSAPASACCSTIDQFNFRSISLEQENRLSITTADSTFPFNGRPVHFAAFKLPIDFAATTIQIKSYLSTDFLPKATAVIPDLIYLDAGLRIVGKTSITNIHEDGGFWGGAFSGKAIVSPEVRYIVVIAGGEGKAYPYASANGRLHFIPAAALGDLSFRLFGETISK